MERDGSLGLLSGGGRNWEGPSVCKTTVNVAVEPGTKRQTSYKLCGLE